MKIFLSGREMKNWEKQAMERYKTPSLLLMERAAMAVVKELMIGAYNLRKVLVACGTGNNGGDGLAVARILKVKGIDVDVCVIGALERLSAETKQQLEMYQAISGKFVTAPAFHEYTVMVDGIFGIGCNREITGIAGEVISAMNECDVPIVAIDVPSGISADTGKVCGVAVLADTTITFFTEKLGMMLYPGNEYCGVIKVAHMGIPFECEESYGIGSYEKSDLKKLPKRIGNSHKGTYGKVLVIAGSQTIFGAAYLAATGAYRMGAGLVKVYTSEENKTAMQTLLPEALLETYDRNRPSFKMLKQSMEWADIIVVGPGLGTDHTAEKILKYVVAQSEVPMVVDADGLNILSKNKRLLEKIKLPVVLTPHILEMSRLIGEEKDKVKDAPIECAKMFAERYPVTIVLKDARTVVAKEGERTFVNTSGTSGMATGGSGDVLAGMIGGLIAQKMEVLDAARLGVYVHGLSGEAAAKKRGCYSMTATDILDGISEVTRR